MYSSLVTVALIFIFFGVDAISSKLIFSISICSSTSINNCFGNWIGLLSFSLNDSMSFL